MNNKTKSIARAGITALLGLSIIGFGSATEANKGDDAGKKDELTALSDEFNDGSTLSSWLRNDQVEGWPSQIDILDVNQSHPGSLTLIPYTATWYGDYRGVYLFKEVTGDFVVTARLKVTGKQSDIPTGSFELAGLLVRAPKNITPATWVPKQENWLYLNYGTPYNPTEMVLDSKTNHQSQFTWEETPVHEGWIQLKIARVGTAYYQFYKYDEQKDWTLLKRYDRPDLPATLQVGINAHGNTKKSFGMNALAFNSSVFNEPNDRADIIAEFDYVRFKRPLAPEPIKEKIVNGDATEQQLQHFLAE
ncbi:hypothetical protein KZ483_04795 [Paenibacillus sp. sptzw28]|uniref:hypothetical protein n=1 Tax=Paenibacillus sp. sptzw28 TaxID=715179 RepID=UPI001C6DFC6B|nr:hypothetical protein [Paenibacillus sp. sptzw28]QYR22314.1 hypothetical protein KZ483_04795 [Paenibacillus sp. sptzw28]